MKKEYKEIKEKLMKFKNYGFEEREGCLLIGKPSHIPPKGWLNVIFASLTKDDVQLLENQLKIRIPDSYKEFLVDFSNGLQVLLATLSLEGFRKHYKRDESAILQPFALEVSNVYERPFNAKDNYFFIGSYRYDGSELYIDTETNHVHFCKRDNATSLYEWNSFEEMLSSEIDRIYKLFTEDGRKIDKTKSTLPV